MRLAGAQGILRRLQLGLFDSGDLHQVPLQADLERGVAMHGHGDAGGIALVPVDVVAARDAIEHPAVRFEQPAKVLTADGFQTAISMTRSVSWMAISSTSTERQPSTAS